METVNNISSEWRALIDEIHRLSYQLRTIVAGRLKEHSITPQEANVLTVIWNSEAPPSLKEINSQLVSETPPSRLVKAMRLRGLVSEKRDVNDERVWRFSLTPEGQKAALLVEEEKERMIRVFDGIVGTENLSTCIEVLRDLEEALD